MVTGDKLLRNLHWIVFPIAIIVWSSYFLNGYSNFNKINAVSMFGSIIQGMSALLSVAIAVIVFRIQSLENRNQSLEQSTLDYIYKIIQWSYPRWDSALENHIRNENIKTRYYQQLFNIRRTQSLRVRTDEEINEECENQQQKLIDVLSYHENVKKTIQRLKDGAFTSTVFLALPIIISAFSFMMSDTWDAFTNFSFVSVVVFLSVLGIPVLLKIIADSTVRETNINIDHSV